MLTAAATRAGVMKGTAAGLTAIYVVRNPDKLKRLAQTATSR